ncbi:DUF6069 family protein [Streptomyces sp. NPDC003737]|uniref:DUF6069 family protein n=1 Tax=Streptomyces sp. NPDC003737 TaxID=3364685 RepID=UPI003694F81F
MNSMNDTEVVAGTVTDRTHRTHRLRRLAGTGFVATLGAMVATTLAAALAQAVGVDFQVPDGGETIPLSGFTVVTGFFSVVGIVIAVALLRWSDRPAKRFVWTTVALTAISLVPPLLSGANTATNHRPPRAAPRRCGGGDPHPGSQPPHPDRLTIPRRTHVRREANTSAPTWSRALRPSIPGSYS